MRVGLMRLAIGAAERALPDRVIRTGMRRVVADRLREEDGRPESERDAMFERWRAGPITLVPERANHQHYEVPAAFFELLLGPLLEYSCCLCPEGVDGLVAPERAVLELTAERAGIRDGMRVLDLGCGWGPSPCGRPKDSRVEVVAVSNSVSQGQFLRRAQSVMTCQTTFTWWRT